MSVPQWAWELARQFRASVGALALCPFDLRAALQWAPSLSVEERSGLTVAHVRRRLQLAGCVAPTERDRPLHACVVARRGAGWIFLDADDPPDEKQFSLAHELAHFLRHHWQPRQKVAALGPDMVALFDGDRAPTDGEQIKAVMHGVPFRAYSHMMRRDPNFLPASVREAEDEADILAFELLAPEELVRARGGDLETVLIQTFGLPRQAAKKYARLLVPGEIFCPFLQILKKMMGTRRTL